MHQAYVQSARPAESPWSLKMRSLSHIAGPVFRIPTKLYCIHGSFPNKFNYKSSLISHVLHSLSRRSFGVLSLSHDHAVFATFQVNSCFRIKTLFFKARQASGCQQWHSKQYFTQQWHTGCKAFFLLAVTGSRGSTAKVYASEPGDAESIPAEAAAFLEDVEC